MPPEISNDQELSLKKRARRRLVGAIALVILMIIILPMILEDRTAVTPDEPIKITMPDEAALDAESNQHVQLDDVVESAPAETPNTNAQQFADVQPSNANSHTEPTPVATAEIVPAVGRDEIKADEVKKEEKPSVKKPEVQKVEEKKPLEKPAETKVGSVDVKSVTQSSGSFTIQVGVYSDAANVKQLQAKLKEAGYNSRTEKISTPKGEKIRLRVGKFASRQEAADALIKINAAGLSGMVMSND
ncbi:MAG: sporulation protein [Methylotenera sp.]|nr:MAG: sporulation protein [Methylotenera sp.]